MNFSIGAKKKKKKNSTKKSLSYGLNERREKKSILLGDDSSDDENDKGQATSNSGRKDVNRAIVAEQAFLRKRAASAVTATASSPSSSGAIYDYDAQYESFSSNVKEQEAQRQPKQKKKDGSRYITKLLKNAKEREKEQEFIRERKIAREQKEEEENEDYMGKEKFITSAYKKKLEERELWKKEDEKKTKIEEENDVTKRKADGLSSFYGNLTKNVTMGGEGSSFRKGDNTITEDQKGSSGAKRTEPSSMLNNDEYHSTKRNKVDEDDIKHSSYPSPIGTASENTAVTGNNEVEEKKKQALKRAAIRSSRAEKIAAARDRYFKRQEEKGVLNQIGELTQ